MMVASAFAKERLRANCYALLSRCYFPPDDSLAAAVKEAGEACGTMASELLRSMERDGSNIEALHMDYVRLFMGPFKTLASPYGSVYMETDSGIMGASTADAVKRYEEDGLENILREPPDHIAVELEYLHFLVAAASNAEAMGNRKEALHYRDRERRFLNSHLGRWAPEFTVNLEENAESAFYRCLAGVTRRFIENAVDAGNAK